MRLHKALTAVVVLMLIATLAFIWGNSLESVQESGAKSGNVFRIVKPLLERFVGKGNARITLSASLPILWNIPLWDASLRFSSSAQEGVHSGGCQLPVRRSCRRGDR